MHITLENAVFSYSEGTPLEIAALSGITCELGPGQVLGILGYTGSGKTTLIRLMSGLASPTKGRVLIDGIDVRSFALKRKRDIGVVFQRPERQLFEETVEREVSYVLRCQPDISQSEIAARTATACEQVGLDLERLRHRSPLSLSDGLKRKVAIAAVLANNPRLIILDEPAVGLDPPGTEQLVATLERMKCQDRRTVVIVSHDMGVFLHLLDKLLVLSDGRMIAFGSPAEVCEALEDDPEALELLPDVARLVHALHKAGVAVEPDEFRVPMLAQRLARLMSM